MAVRKPLPVQKNNDSTLVSWLAGTVVVLVGVLIVGGYWMQQQRVDQSALSKQADVYDAYQQYTRSNAAPRAAETPRAVSEAQETRKYLLGHPAVTPGSGFDKPGVQATGKTIVKAIDQAKGL